MDSRVVMYRFVIYKDRAGLFRWALYAEGDEAVADSADGHRSLVALEREIAGIRGHVAAAEVAHEYAGAPD